MATAIKSNTEKRRGKAGAHGSIPWTRAAG